MSITPDHFPTDVEGLPAAHGPQRSKLADGDEFNLRIGPVAKRIGDGTARMLAYNDSIPGPVLEVQEGSEIIVNIENQGDMEATVHWHGLRLENRYDGTHETQAPIQVGERFSARVAFPDPGSCALASVGLRVRVPAGTAHSPLVEAVAQTPSEAAGSLLRVGSEIGHLVGRERPVGRKVVPHGGSGMHLRERAPRFLRRLYATASVRGRRLGRSWRRLPCAVSASAAGRGRVTAASIGDDREAVLACHAPERLYIACGKRGRLDPAASRRADLRKHSFHSRRRVHEQHAREPVANIAEVMQSAPRHEDHAIHLGPVYVVCDMEIQDPFQQDEGLVLRMVDVRRGSGLRGNEGFKQGQRPARLRTGQQRRVRVAHKEHRVAGARGNMDRLKGLFHHRVLRGGVGSPTHGR
jgi:Multicopper oxidase